ncbi:MAG TPA: beta-ketoacyl synthase chain length factor [Puia sp.]|nr:beta-ketoacyl synthase chain length factor [Puia sp.]
MLYFHQAVCISPLPTFGSVDLTRPGVPQGNKLLVKEPAYEGIPANLVRRTGKAVRMGVGVSMPILRATPVPVSGIIIGTANGGTEDSFRFLQQIIDYKEDTLAPGSFVQSTANAAAAQISLLDKNKGYNLTHVHRGLAFEFALLDAVLLSEENKEAYYLLAGIDETSGPNFMLDAMEGWHKKETLQAGGFYAPDSPGAIAGEGAAGFSVSGQGQNALARLAGVSTLHSNDPVSVRRRMEEFLQGCLPADTAIDLFLSGENGDCRLQKFYTACETGLPAEVPIARFKHCCGEYPTASAFAVWLCCQLLSGMALPEHMVKRGKPAPFQTILLYNNYKGLQHSFILLSVVR